MKNRISCLALCLLLLIILASCETVEDTFPIFEFEQSDAWVDVNNATLTMYFATEDQNGDGWIPNDTLVLYVSNSDKALAFDHAGEKIADYRSIEGYTPLSEYSRSSHGSKYAATKMPFSGRLKYQYCEDILIPSEYLQGEQGELHFYLCDVSKTPDGYMMVTLRYIKNVGYLTKDGMVTFDFENCTIGNPRH
ncbi:MAG: hypothetical protein J6S28_10720 [Clostridia bacterium]|nr:hypothetical protein [Clostridia bacterium]